MLHKCLYNIFEEFYGIFISFKKVLSKMLPKKYHRRNDDGILVDCIGNFIF